MSRMRAIIGMMLASLWNNPRMSIEQKETEAKHLNKISGGMALGNMMMSSPYNQRQRRKRIRQNPHLAKKYAKS